MEYGQEFYNSKKWKRVKALILKRDNYLCRECKRYGKMVAAEHVHHIEHLDARPDLAYTPSNLISLCAKCHLKMHPEKTIKANKSRAGNKY